MIVGAVLRFSGACNVDVAALRYAVQGDLHWERCMGRACVFFCAWHVCCIACQRWKHWRQQVSTSRRVFLPSANCLFPSPVKNISQTGRYGTPFLFCSIVRRGEWESVSTWTLRTDGSQRVDSKGLGYVGSFRDLEDQSGQGQVVFYKVRCWVGVAR